MNVTKRKQGRKNMRITVKYPEMMKMEFTSQIEFDPKTVTLLEIKEKIYTNIWGQFEKNLKDGTITKHGELDEICFFDSNFEIKTDEDLKKRLFEGGYFNAVFKKQTQK